MQQFYLFRLWLSIFVKYGKTYKENVLVRQRWEIMRLLLDVGEKDGWV